MKTLNAEGVLSAWQAVYGELESHHKEMFLAHSAMSAILQFPDNWIRECFKFTPKLQKVLKILIESEKLDKLHGKNVMAESRNKIEETILKAAGAFQYNTGDSKEHPSFGTDWWREQE